MLVQSLDEKGEGLGVRLATKNVEVNSEHRPEDKCVRPAMSFDGFTRSSTVTASPMKKTCGGEILAAFMS